MRIPGNVQGKASEDYKLGERPRFLVRDHACTYSSFARAAKGTGVWLYAKSAFSL
jgi:hypothetical protein